ncbi:MqnA/MqnD/SBP family protein, partial [Acinetobacter baumannii]
MKGRVGSVPYVNAAPLVWSLERHGVEVVTAVPSGLPALLAAGEVQAILVSSVF